VLGRRSSTVSLVTVAAAVLLTWHSTSWLFVTLIMLLMLYMMGAHHPTVPDELAPLSSARKLVVAAIILIFIVCFTPTLIEPLQLVPQ
jgi:hypothetical protein